MVQTDDPEGDVRLFNQVLKVLRGSPGAVGVELVMTVGDRVVHMGIPDLGVGCTHQLRHELAGLLGGNGAVEGPFPLS